MIKYFYIIFLFYVAYYSNTSLPSESQANFKVINDFMTIVMPFGFFLNLSKEIHYWQKIHIRIHKKIQYAKKILELQTTKHIN